MVKNLIISAASRVFGRFLSLSFWRLAISRIFLVWRWGKVPVLIALIIVFRENSAAFSKGWFDVALSIGQNLGGSLRVCVTSFSQIGESPTLQTAGPQLWDILTAYLHIAVYFRTLAFMGWLVENSNYSPIMLYGLGSVIFVLLVVLDAVVNGNALPVNQIDSAVKGFKNLLQLDFFRLSEPVNSTGSVNGSVNSSGNESFSLKGVFK